MPRGAAAPAVQYVLAPSAGPAAAAASPAAPAWGLPAALALGVGSPARDALSICKNMFANTFVVVRRLPPRFTRTKSENAQIRRWLPRRRAGGALAALAAHELGGQGCKYVNM